MSILNIILFIILVVIGIYGIIKSLNDNNHPLCALIITVLLLFGIGVFISGFNEVKYLQNNYTYEKTVTVGPYTNKTIHNNTDSEYIIKSDALLQDITIKPNKSYTIQNVNGIEKEFIIYKENTKEDITVDDKKIDNNQENIKNKYCFNCGEKVQQDNKYCSNCGSKLN